MNTSPVKNSVAETEADWKFSDIADAQCVTEYVKVSMVEKTSSGLL